MLRNPALKGTRIYRPTLPDGSYATEPEVTTEGNWTPILDPALWQQVVDVLDARKARRMTWPGAGSVKRVHPFSGLIRCAKCGTVMRKQGKVYICVQYQRGVCSRSISHREITELIEEAVLSVFAQIALTPEARPTRSAASSTGNAELRAQLDTDREALDRLDDDHYDGVIDRATWMRQRTRLVERIASRQREYQQHLAAVPVVDVNLDLATVAAEWEGRTATWKHEATRLVLQSVLIHEHPEGVPTIVGRRKTDTPESYRARMREHRQELLARRVELIWHA